MSARPHLFSCLAGGRKEGAADGGHERWRQFVLYREVMIGGMGEKIVHTIQVRFKLTKVCQNY